MTACTLQGMARVPAGHAAAWPLVSGLNVRRSPGSSVTSRTSTTTALMPTGWPSTAGRESPSEDEPGGRPRPGRAAALAPGPAAPASLVAPPTASDFALHVPWLTGHRSLLCARLGAELCPSCYLASDQEKLRTTNLPRLDIRSAMAQSYQLLISDRCSSPSGSSSTSPPSR
jgi:hypothetical protein